MPKAPPAACSTPMCAGMATKGTRCIDCTKEAHTSYRASPERARLNKFYMGMQWRSLSKAFRRRHPLCAHCTAMGVVRPCDMVDHIQPVRTHWDRRYMSANLQALCHPCHALKTARDRS